MRVLSLMIFVCFLQACGQDAVNAINQSNTQNDSISEIDTTMAIQMINPDGTTIATRFNPPKGFLRTNELQDSFGRYLRNLTLKEHGAEVKLYNGDTKSNYRVYDAVVDLPIGTKNLHQCADAIIRLRAEYLWKNEAFEKIHFNFTNGFRVNYSEWMKGKRISVQGNQVRWVNRNSPSNTSQDLWNYLELIFNYAGTLSLSKEMKPKDISEVKIGDIFRNRFRALALCLPFVHPTGLHLFGQLYLQTKECIHRCRLQIVFTRIGNGAG